MERERLEAEAEETREEQQRRGGKVEAVSPRKDGHLSAGESRDVTLLNGAPMASAEAVDEVEIRAPVGIPFVYIET
jgi:hypothetical protein